MPLLGLDFDSAVYDVKLEVIEQVKGTKESEECSNRGICDPTDGYCTCEVNFDTSDGYIHRGQRGDCGFPTTVIQQCPGVLSCSGHGVCSESPRFRCDCSEGWTGSDCSNHVCPKGTSWFTLPQSANLAHVYEQAECSDMGVCNRETGECVCAEGFTGSSCNRMTCPGEVEGVDGSVAMCSGHGQCLDMSSLVCHT